MCVDVDKELLKALKVAFPMQLWGVHGGRFIWDTGTRERYYARAEVVGILIRERRVFQASAELIQKALNHVTEGKEV